MMSDRNSFEISKSVADAEIDQSTNGLVRDLIPHDSCTIIISKRACCHAFSCADEPGAAPKSILRNLNIAVDNSMYEKRILELMASRNVTRKGAEKISNILRVGAEILLEEGFTSVTNRRVAKRLGIVHSNVGYYFPTRASLWQAVVDSEFKSFYNKYQREFESDPSDAQACFDEYLTRWLDEYGDRRVRTFFALVVAYAEINSTIAKLRDEIYDGILMRITLRIRALFHDVDDEQIEQRALTLLLLFEGLQTVSAYRPELLRHDNVFRQNIVDRANAIIRA